MSGRDKERITELQRQVRIAKSALERIEHGTMTPQTVAEEALDTMWPLDKKQPIQGVVGHERRPR